MKRHVLTIVTHLICNAYMHIAFFLIVFDYERLYQNFINTWWIYMFKVLYISQGIPTFLIRLSEPYFYILFKRKIVKALKKICRSKEAR